MEYYGTNSRVFFDPSSYIRPWCTDFVILTNITFTGISNVTGTLSRILNYSQLCGWELGSSGPWRRVTGWSVGNVYMEHNAIVFKDLAVRQTIHSSRDTRTWRYSCERSGRFYPLSLLHSRDERVLLQNL